MPHKHARILNVDDNEAGRYVITRTLQRAGYTVEEAATAADALRIAETLPDLMVLDIKLPDMSGLEVCGRIKANPRTSGIMILHVSANFVRAEHRVEALEGGADGYLTYPLEPSELLANVRSLLRLRQAEEEAREAVREWRSTFDAINDGVCLMNSSGEVLRCNRAMCRFLSRQPEEVVGKLYAELLRNAFTSGTVPEFQELLAEPGREAEDLRIGERWFRLTTDPVVDEAGVPRGAVCIVSDVTDRKRLNAELQRQAEELIHANAAKDEFLAMLGHELRNPLSPILNSLELLRGVSGDDQTLHRAHEIIQRQSRQMARLVDDLLDVARITRGKVELRREGVDLRAVLENSVQTAHPAILERNHQLAVRLPDQPVYLDADPLRLEQVFANLLHNAAKYTDPSGCIELSLTQDGPQAVVRVRDTGRGIPAEMLPHVFDLFTQVSPTLDRTQGGLGLGLTLVKRLVTMHGGSVEARSDGPGKGAEFTVQLPTSRPGSQVQSSGSPSPVSTPAERQTETQDAGRRVLVVEDNPDARETLQALLEMWGHEVRTAPDGPSGAELAAEWKPDVALIDIGLPGMDGYGVAARIRARDGAQPRLVALTGYGQPEDRQRALEAGFDTHAVKPVDPEELARLVR